MKYMKNCDISGGETDCQITGVQNEKLHSL